MTETAIRVENLGKRYVLGKAQDASHYKTLRETVSAAVRRPFRRSAPVTSNDEFWALKDLSFDIKQGQVVGVIGRNGAGKSTLLKVLSRITEPTAGRITINGRVASLLEVGTGFHPELTGRENIFLNGAVLGMQRGEIKAKFDEIVAFAEVEKFLDTPVKRYSSGMYVRLAFAVAAHLEPEILVVDEVLAVGDAEFQKKCLGKMKSVSQGGGRTILFVSHNMGAITQLCDHALYLENGRKVDYGEVGKIAARYLENGTTQRTERTWTEPGAGRAPGDEVVRLSRVRAITRDRELLPGSVDVRQAVGIEIQYRVLKEGAIFAPSLHLHNAEGTQLFLAIDLEDDWVLRPRPCGDYQSTAWIPGNFLNIGMHYVSVAISRLDLHWLHLFEQQVIAFHVDESNANDTSRGIYAGHLPGVIRPILEWQTLPIKS